MLTDGRAREGSQPNVILFDGKRLKAFRALEFCAWQRRSIGVAKLLTDWTPAQHTGCPELPLNDQAETEVELSPYLFGHHDDASAL
jgi:hypothetical protein